MAFTADTLRESTMGKLRGYDFYRAIGSPRCIVAPMVDQSELAFRMLCRTLGADCCYTPMLHSRLFVESAEYRDKMFEHHIHDRPLIVQFCGNDPTTVLTAAKMVERHCDAVDLNLGCPQGIARKGHYGSFLMHDKGTVKSIVETLSAGLAIPVTVKIRVFPDDRETLEFAQMLQDAGCDLLTVHGRTKEMNKTAVGAINWDIIRRIKERLSIPVIANGGVETHEDIARCLEATGCDGVMSSEGVLENPALFADGNNAPGTDTSFLELARQYLEFATLYPPASDKIVRAHLFKILFQDLRVHSDLRDALAAAKSQEEMVHIVDELAERLNRSVDTTAEGDMKKGMIYAAKTSWYRRHRQGQEKLRRRDSYEKCLDTGFGNLFG
uniref:tRNA-dihydrouridine(16/17) synthase [NAD(P)(+)] n=1 Tax=Peronospora matthiolae TaxID=2874970 RepID=A0AAV1TTN1_9STRA